MVARIKGDGGVIQPAERCTKTDDRVMDMLRTKHPEALPPTVFSLDLYLNRPLELVPVDIINYTVTAVAVRLSGGAGRGGGCGLSQSSTLATTFWGGERGTADNCRGLHGVAEKWAASMGRLPCHDEQPADSTGKAARGQTVRGRKNLASIDVQVPVSGDGE